MKGCIDVDYKNTLLFYEIYELFYRPNIKKFQLLLKFETGENETEISIDDVTMIADSCSKYWKILLIFNSFCLYVLNCSTTIRTFLDKTVSTLLNKGNGLQCTFGGDFDVCFRQSESNNDTNWRLSNVRIDSIA